MTCRTPKVYRAPYMIPGAAPSTANDRYPLIDVRDEEIIAAIELDTSSEIDSCIVQHTGGFVHLAVGSPAVGPFHSPLQVLPGRRVLPYGPEVQGFTGEPLLSTPPILAVKVHYDMPPWFLARRAPIVRAMPQTNPEGTLGAAYAVVAEVPLYGFLRGRLAITAIAQSLTYKIEGTHYRGRQLSSEVNGEPLSTSTSPTLVQLVLDGTGALERTVAAATTEGLDVIEEPYDTLVVSAKQGSGAGSVRIVWRAEGDS
jgi:hypothetical protein